MILPCLRRVEQGVELSLYVQPRASRNQLAGLHGDELKVKLTAPPVDGAANLECRSYFSKLFKIPKNRVVLTAGDTSRHKRLLLVNLDITEVSTELENRLGA